MHSEQEVHGSYFCHNGRYDKTGFMVSAGVLQNKG